MERFKNSNNFYEKKMFSRVIRFQQINKIKLQNPQGRIGSVIIEISSRDYKITTNRGRTQNSKKIFTTLPGQGTIFMRYYLQEL